MFKGFYNLTSGMLTQGNGLSVGVQNAALSREIEVTLIVQTEAAAAGICLAVLGFDRKITVAVNGKIQRLVRLVEAALSEICV